ncbi:MAG TPA: helix-turn-helix domain-containing protein [Dehalococcoidia bacterium]|nr:helix-turn-helix domain-containing protein [Dehalococcoidia bacterium]
MAEPSTFGELLYRHRLAAGLTQESLAERAQISVRAISDLERGVRRLPYRHTVNALADALSLSSANRAEFASAAQRPRRPVLLRTRMDEAVTTAAKARLGSALPDSLPVPLTRLIGREDDIAAVQALLQHTRVLTLTGPGGTGKTRLALAVAASVRQQFIDGVCFVDLSSLRDPALVLSSIAVALGEHEDGRPLRTVLPRVLRERHLLILLDNFEQLVAGAAEVAALLAACPGLKVLATSRAPLRIQGEQEYPVRPLPLPDDDEAFGRRPSGPALTLFAERARAVRPDLMFTPEHTAACATICRQLDGLPLAIELAAARVKLLPPAALLARLDRRMPLLVDGTRDAPARQRTLRDTLAWSYDLLTPAEQALFRRLAVFAGGWTLEAAERVCGYDTHPAEVFERLSTLVSQSLVVENAGPDGEPRFRMLETVREFACELLDASDEAPNLRRRHAEYILTLAARARPALRSAGRRPWDERLAAERENMRAALDWTVVHEPELGLCLVSDLQLWIYRFMVAEGRRRVEALLVAPGVDPRSAGRAGALVTAAILAFVQSDVRAARRWAGEAVARWRYLGEPAEHAWAQAWLVAAVSLRGAWYAKRGRPYQVAAAVGVASVASFRRLGDRWGLAASLLAYGIFLFSGGDHIAGRPVLEECAALFQALGDAWWGAAPLMHLSCLALAEGTDRRARGLLEEGLRLSRDGGDKNNIAHFLDLLARVLEHQGEYGHALVHMRESLELRREIGSVAGIAACLDGFAVDVAARGDSETATRLCGAAAALRAPIGAQLRMGIRELTENLIADLRGALGTTAFQSAWNAGQCLSEEQAIAIALDATAPAW